MRIVLIKITRCKSIFSKRYTKNYSKEIFFINSVLKTSLWTYKIKDLYARKLQEAYMKMNCC